MNFLYFIIVDAIAGWLAGKVMKGSLVGGFLFSLIGMSSTGGLIASILVAMVGAMFLIWLVGMRAGKKS